MASSLPSRRTADAHPVGVRLCLLGPWVLYSLGGVLLMKNFKGAGLRMRDDDLPRIGAKIGVGEDEMHAFLDVEASGAGFDSAGRPKMLFEPHKFYAALGAGAKRDRAVREGLAYPQWGQQKYPSDSYPRLARAIQIDEVAALRSCSWGIGQVMGFNHKLAGYDTVQQMVTAFMGSEGAQLEGAVYFIKSAKLDDDLRAHRWADFARGYNGEKYAEHGYHTKLAAAYAKWAKIPDTPWDGEALPPTKPIPPDVVKPPKPRPKAAPKAPGAGTAVGGTVATGGAVVVAKQKGWGNDAIIAIILGGLAVAAIAALIVRRLRK